MSQPTKSAKEIFLSAVDKSDPGQREAYLREACGTDIQRRRHVEALLRAHGEPDSLLDQERINAGVVVTAESGADATLDPASLAERPGATIGRYTLLEEIGEGGMGVVYMAEQREPVRRKVAFKIIKLGMDTREVIARFEAERQTLAMMDHPNIAHVLDGGATESGRPYFVMELVSGIPITDYCDQAGLTTQKRLELFVLVCQAVHHAHQKGIIHRDVKPSNVLVALHDGVPVPKIIDFGIAKVVRQQLAETAFVTGHGQMVGTPLYMSPEQAGMSGLDVDTRSDIYSLGVLLYELLTGRTPFDRERLHEAGLDEVRRAIREEEPPRPSHRLSTLDAEALSTITAHRGVDARRLGRLLRGDLDWIVMKALEKDRARRYESAADFARDIERYLSDEPVEARPPKLSDRVAKWARRHRPVVWAAAATLLLAMVGSLASAFFIAKAYMQEKEQREIAAQQSVLAKENAARAEKNYQTAREAVKQMLTRVANEEVGAIPEMKEVRRALLEDAVAFYTELLKLNPGDAIAYRERGDVYQMLAKFKEAFADYDKSLELDPEDARVHRRLWMLFKNPYGCVDVAYRDAKRALVHAKRAAEIDPQNMSYQIGLAVSYVNVGEKQEARKLLQKILEGPKLSQEIADPNSRCVAHLLDVCHLTGDAAGALPYLQKWSTAQPSSPYFHYSLALVLADLGDRKKALVEANTALEHGSADQWLYHGLALFFTRLGDYQKELVAATRSIEVNPTPNDPISFSIYQERGDAYMHLEMHEAALADYDRSIELAPFRNYSHKRRGLAHFYLKNYDKALADIARAVELKADDTSNLSWIPPELVARCPDERFRKGLVELADKTIEMTKGTVEAYGARAKLYAAFGQSEKATAVLEQMEKAKQTAIAVLQKEMEQSSGDPEYRKQIATQHFLAADGWFHADQIERALPHLDLAIQFNPEYSEAYDHRGYIYLQRGDLDRAIDDYTESIRFGAAYGVSSYPNRAAALLNKGDYDRAIADLSKGVELEAGKANSWYRRALVRAAAGRAEDYRKDCVEMLQRFDQTENPGDAHWVAWVCALAPDATADWPKVIALAEKAAKSDPKSLQYQNTFGAVLYRAGRLDEAVRQLDQADRLANEPNQAVQSSPAYTWFFLAVAHCRLGHGEEAKKWLDKAVTSTEKAHGEQKQGTADVPWNRRLTLKLLRDEAEALLKSAPAAPSPKPTAKEKEKTEEKPKAESGKQS